MCVKSHLMRRASLRQLFLGISTFPRTCTSAPISITKVKNYYSGRDAGSCGNICPFDLRAATRRPQSELSVGNALLPGGRNLSDL